MIIQALLTVGLLACLMYFQVNRAQLRVFAAPVFLLILAGLYLVWVPQDANEFAHALGVGRGADLLLYGWVVISFAVILMLHVRERRTLSTITGIVRAIAVENPRRPPEP